MWKCLFIILVLLTSCKKERTEAIPTIYPLEYLPVYPGSEWKYIDEVGDTVVQSTAPEYQLHQYKCEKLYGQLTDNVYVPFWNGKPIYGYSTPLTPGYSYYSGLTQIGYLSQKKGEQWTTDGGKFGRAYRVVENIDTNIIVNSVNYSNVIIVRSYSQIHVPNIRFLNSISYYAKNIGLIKEDYYQSDTLTKYIDIVSYSINH